MFNFFRSKNSEYANRIFDLETKIIRMQAQIEVLKTELLMIPVRSGLAKLQVEIADSDSSKTKECCDAGCNLTPNCPKSGSVF